MTGDPSIMAAVTLAFGIGVLTGATGVAIAWLALRWLQRLR